MFRYNVTLQSQTGETITVPYAVQWSPAKVDPMFVAQACAIEKIVEAGRNADGSWRLVCQPVSAELLELEEELAELVEEATG